MSNKIMLDLIDKALENEVCSRHSYFQLRYFLIGKEPTIQAKMWQCLRELKTRRESLSALDLEIEETKDKIELLNINIEKIKIEQNFEEPDNTKGHLIIYIELNKQEGDIKIRQAERQIKSAEVNLAQLTEKQKWLEEECQFFLQTFIVLEKTEKLKHFDDVDSQKQYWSDKLTNKLNLRMLTGNPLDIELIETIISLPDDMPVKKQTINTLNNRHAQMADALKKIEEKKENKEA